MLQMGTIPLNPYQRETLKIECIEHIQMSNHNSNNYQIVVKSKIKPGNNGSPLREEGFFKHFTLTPGR